MLKIKFLPYQEVRLVEASSLVYLDLRKSNFFPFKSDLQISGLVLLVLLVLVFWYFWYFCETRVSLSGRSNH